MFETIWFSVLMLFILSLSWLSAIFSGHSWADSRAIGGPLRFLERLSAGISGAGFMLVYAMLMDLFLSGVKFSLHAFLWHMVHNMGLAEADGLSLKNSIAFLPDSYAGAVIRMAPIFVYVAMFDTGIAIAADWWATKLRQKVFAGGDAEASASFIRMHKFYADSPDLRSLLKGKLAKISARIAKRGIITMALLVVLALSELIFELLVGALTAASIIRRAAAKHGREVIASSPLFPKQPR